MTLSRSCLSETQFKVLQSTADVVTPKGFYLAGGTALAVYFAHRRSQDLDWFCPATLGDPLILAAGLKKGGIDFVTNTITPDTLNGAVHSVRSSFMTYAYPLLSPLVPWQEGRCSLASLDDLACMKLAAVAQRGSRKDFVDVYTLLVSYKPLADLLALFRKKYAAVNEIPVLMGLSFFEDAEKEPPLPGWSGDWQVVKEFISRQVKEYSAGAF